MKSKMVAIAALFWAISYCPSASPAADKLRLGYSSVSALHGNTWVAEEKGLFKKYGIELENIYMQGDPITVSALIAGDVQFIKVGGGAIVNAALKGADVAMVASVINAGVQRLLARQELAKPADLKGKKIGITRLGSSSHLVLGLFLKHWGMSLGDVQIFQVGTSPAMLAALDNGGIDAAVLSIPTFFVAEEKGYRVLADAAEMNIYYLHNVVATTRKFVQTHRDVALRFIKAYIEGNAYYKKNKQESLEVLKLKLRAQGGQKYLEKSYDLFSKYFDRVPYVSREGVKLVLEFEGRERKKVMEADPDIFINNSLVKEVEASGFISSLYGR